MALYVFLKKQQHFFNVLFLFYESQDAESQKQKLECPLDRTCTNPVKSGHS